jgi:hypothetical protein
LEKLFLQNACIPCLSIPSSMFCNRFSTGLLTVNCKHWQWCSSSIAFPFQSVIGLDMKQIFTWHTSYQLPT